MIIIFIFFQLFRALGDHMTLPFMRSCALILGFIVSVKSRWYSGTRPPETSGAVILIPNHGIRRESGLTDVMNIRENVRPSRTFRLDLSRWPQMLRSARSRTCACTRLPNLFVIIIIVNAELGTTRLMSDVTSRNVSGVFTALIRPPPPTLLRAVLWRC